jgi:hypothetical protein
MTKEALKLALEALECLKRDFDADQFEWEISDVAITAIKEALAQTEQEPVAWEQFYPDMGKPQFTPPQRTWAGLTLDDIPDDDTNNLDFYRGGRWAERILKEKNYD